MWLDLLPLQGWLIACIYRYLFGHSSIDEHLGCFHLLVTVNNSAITMDEQLSLWNPALNSFGYMPRSGIAGLYASSIFNFLRKLHTVFYRGCTILHSQQQCTRVPMSPHSCPRLSFSHLLTVTILMAMRWYLIEVLICFYLMASDTEHLFICLLAIFISSLENCLFKSSVHF